MRFVDLFAGIGGFRLGMEAGGMECVGGCEIDRFARECYGVHFGLDGMEEDIRGMAAIPPCDVVCAGFPCQDNSVARKGRKGLRGDESGLFFQIVRLLQQTDNRPEWLILENVCGLLTAERGMAFRDILDELGGCGYVCQWRVLNARYFGLAQQRRRVFLVANTGAEPCEEILFECEAGGGHTKKGKGARTEVARTLTKSTGGISPRGHQMTLCIASTIEPGVRIPNRDIGQIVSHGLVRNLGHTDNGQGLVAGNVSCKWRKSTGGPAGDECQNLTAGQNGVRRLTPMECERLQGFPDGWTAMLSDTQRYNCVGNAVPPPMVEWIARRIVRAREAVCV